MRKFKFMFLLAATVMLIGCRAAARHTGAWIQDRMTLTQSTYREPDVVPVVLAEATSEPESLIALEAVIDAETLIAAETMARSSQVWGAAVSASRPAGGCTGDEILDVAIERRIEWRRSAKAS